MKTLKTFILLLFIIPMIFSCEEEKIDPIPQPVLKPGVKVFGTFDMVTHSKIEKLNDHYVELTYELEGEGTTNLMDIASIRLKYEEFIEIRNDSSLINNGSFTILASSGEEISGGFSGHLYSNATGTEEFVFAAITNGTHQYKDSKGDLSLIFKKNLNKRLQLEIQGKIYLKKEVQPQ